MAKYRKFDVFLSHNSRDKQQARELKQKLSEIRIRAWLDEDELRPGIKWQPALEDALKSAPSFLVLIGPSGLGPWADVEMQAGLTLAVKDGRPIFLVIYGADEEQISLPLFLSSIYGRIKIDQGIDERVLSQLRWAITGKKPRAPRLLKREQKVNAPQEESVKSDADYLLAKREVQILLGHAPEFLVSEMALNRETVTRHVKNMLRSTATQMEAIRAVRKLFDLAGLAEKGPLAYLLGRFTDRHCRKEAAATLVDCFNRELAELKGSNTPASITHSTETKQLLLLERTVCISLVYLGEDKYADYYCERLLHDSACDVINRCFHLQYYDDYAPNVVTDNNICTDNLRFPPWKTCEVLISKLEADLKVGKFRPMSSIEAQTLVSVCVNRHLYALLPDSLRLRLLPVLNEILLSPQKVFTNSLTSFLGSGRDLLEMSGVSVGNLFGEILSLKDVRRSGWNMMRVVGKRNIQRICPNPESVADHNWGCVMIACAFLPEQLETEIEYRKSRVIEMILVHDMAEAWLADIPDQLKSQDTLFAESRIMERCAHLFRSADLRGSSDWFERWKKFNDQKDINAKIASDIDRIETCLQVTRYTKMHGCVMPDAEELCKEIERKMQTAEGHRILRLLRKHPTTIGAGQ